MSGPSRVAALVRRLGIRLAGRRPRRFDEELRRALADAEPVMVRAGTLYRSLSLPKGPERAGSATGRNV